MNQSQTVKVSIEFLLSHKSDVYDLGRIPCVGELIAIDDDTHYVNAVIHMANADPETQVLAIVRVK